MSQLHVPYWLIGDKKIYNQFEANQLAFCDGAPAYRLVFLEDVYDQLDWTTEPNESWEELCLQRALYLRHKWKKLKLCFSAGRDSGHIMQLFERHGIPIDELILPYAPYHPMRLYEHQHYVKPAAEELCRRNPGMTMREICLDHTFYNNLYQNPDWLTGPNSQQRAMLFIPYDWKTIIETDPDHSNGTTGYMFGLEKPRIRLNNGNFIFQLLDTDVQYFAQGIHNAEWFYWAPEQPKLFLKQCWMLINHFEQHYPGASAEFVQKFQKTDSGYYDEFCRSVGRGDALSWGVGNAQGKISNNYHWSIQSTINTAKEEGWKGFKEWWLTIADLKKNYSHFYNQNDPLCGTIGIWGKPYTIKQQNIIG
jgi:hypothetical protein